jgi:hypothetical protein
MRIRNTGTDYRTYLTDLNYTTNHQQSHSGLKHRNNQNTTFFLASLKSMKKGVGPGVGSGSINQMYGSGDPDTHQNVTDPQQHC